MKRLTLALARMRASFIVIRSHTVLIWYQVINLLLQLGMVAVIIFGMIRLWDLNLTPSQFTLFESLILIAAVISMNLIGIFLAGAVFTAATAALEGEKMSFRSSFAQAWRQRKALVSWWLFSSGAFIILFLVNLGLDKLLRLLGGNAGRILSSIFRTPLTMGWGFATYFAVPILMTHPDKPLPTLKRSTELFRSSWGENIAADFGLFLVGLLIFMGAGFVVSGINFTIYSINPGVNSIVFALVYAAIAGSVLATLLLTSMTTRAVFHASLYRYAETGDYVGPFTPEMIQGAFLIKPKKVRTQ